MQPSSEDSSRTLPRKSGLYYGYVIVAAAFVMMTMSWGIFYVFGVFFQSLTDEFGWPRAITSGAYSASIVLSGLPGLAAGRLSDRFGPRVVIMSGTGLLALGYILMSTIHSTWQFYVIYGLLISIGIGAFWSPLVSTVARWFTGKRGLMTGIVSGGIGFGSLVFAPAVALAISVLGWRPAFIIVGASVLLTVVLSALFIKRAPKESDLLFIGGNEDRTEKEKRGTVDFSLGQAMHTRQFWLMCFIYFCLGFSQVTVLVHIVPHASDIGISALNSAIILSVIGGVGLASRIVIGAIADRTRVKTSFIVSTALLLASLLWLQVAVELWQLYLFAFVFGLAYGGSSCLQSLIAAELFGLTSLGVIVSTFSFSFGIGGGAGPFLAGHVFDLYQSYWPAIMICIVLVGAALIGAGSLRPPGKDRPHDK